MQQYDLVALRSFVTVVEVGSFNRAAQMLEASTAAVSRRVSALEAALGVKLLNRTTRQLDLTEAGGLFYTDVINIFHALDEAEERLQQGRESIRGTLRLAAPLSFGLQCLSPALPHFLKRYPELQVQLQLEDRTTDLVAEGIDLAVRIGSLKDSSLVATRIGNIPRVFCASPDYLQQYGEPVHPRQLIEHNCMHYSVNSNREQWHFSDASAQRAAKVSKDQVLEVPGSLSTNNGEVLQDAAIAGVGIVLLPEFIVRNALSDGRLKTILSQYTPEPHGLFAMRPSRQFTPNKVKVMMQYLKEVCAAYVE
jgi:DNA-binding transcriptional LysR family regulator